MSETDGQGGNVAPGAWSPATLEDRWCSGSQDDPFTCLGCDECDPVVGDECV
jgi:hypothetical protein